LRFWREYLNGACAKATGQETGRNAMNADTTMANGMPSGSASGRSGIAALFGDKTALVVIMAILLAVLVLPPLIFLIKGAITFTDDAGNVRISFERFALLAGQKGIWLSTWNSIVFAVLSALFALLLGGIVAWIVERTDAPFKRLAYFTTILSLGTPYVLYTTAWLLIMSKSGPLNNFLKYVTGSTGPVFNVYGMPGMVIIEALLWSPLVFLLLGGTLRNFNPELEEAAKMSGASNWDTIRRVTFKLSLPSILALAMLVFIRTIEAFEVPALVGTPGRMHVLTTDIYDIMHRTNPPDIGTASALSVLLLALVGVLLYYYNRLTRSVERFATITGKNFRPREFELGKWRIAAGLFVVFYFTVMILLPLAVLVWTSLVPFETFRLSVVKRMSFENYRTVFAGGQYVDLLVNTFLIALVAATVTMLIAATIAWLSVRKVTGARVLDQLATTPLVFPGIVLGVGVMQFFLTSVSFLYATIWIIAWAFVINYMPYGVRYSYAGMLQVHRELEESAAVSGATTLTTFRRIVLPLLAPSVLAGWLFIFLLSTRVLSLPVLLAGPTSQTMAVAMFDLWGNGQGPELAALGLLWSFLMTTIALVFYFLTKRSGTGMYGQS
jgi:iron(III) transport system permease protein